MTNHHFLKFQLVGITNKPFQSGPFHWYMELVDGICEADSRHLPELFR
jgi:hypothetical protein